MASDPPLPNAAFATRAVAAGTSGHGCGCNDMTTPSRGRERRQEISRPRQTIMAIITPDTDHIGLRACRRIRQQDRFWVHIADCSLKPP